LLVVQVMVAVPLTSPVAVSALITGGVRSSVVNVAGEAAAIGDVALPEAIADVTR
jgi:hypothetical protein